MQERMQLIADRVRLIQTTDITQDRSDSDYLKGILFTFIQNISIDTRMLNTEKKFFAGCLSIMKYLFSKCVTK